MRKKSAETTWQQTSVTQNTQQTFGFDLFAFAPRLRRSGRRAEGRMCWGSAGCGSGGCQAADAKRLDEMKDMVHKVWRQVALSLHPAGG